MHLADAAEVVRGGILVCCFLRDHGDVDVGHLLVQLFNGCRPEQNHVHLGGVLVGALSEHLYSITKLAFLIVRLQL